MLSRDPDRDREAKSGALSPAARARDMRFDEVSAKYAEFGDFYVGRLISG